MKWVRRSPRSWRLISPRRNAEWNKDIMKWVKNGPGTYELMAGSDTCGIVFGCRVRRFRYLWAWQAWGHARGISYGFASAKLAVENALVNKVKP